ncbi:MAG: hypothetical protein IPJ74_14825 [Saprospiraceae bacterium]|nr:hypothetical protein [Saprospiraceae bacterium]
MQKGDMGTQTYTFTVTSDKAVDVPFTVNVNTVDGTATVGDADYVNNSTTLNFAGTVGETQTFDVTVNGDMKVEPNETFTVPLSMVAASGRNVVISGIQGTGTGTITNDDAATISIDDVSLAEGNAGTTNFIFTVSLSKVVSTAVTVNFTTADGTATLANLDYNMNSNSITFPANGAGQSQTITVQVVGDVFGEPNETFFVNLTSIQGNPPNISFADAQGLGTILDDDLSFSINDVTLAEGDAGTTNFTFTVTRTSTATVESIDFTTANNTATTGDNDYVLNSGTLNFAIGDNSETITVVVNGDMKVELDETFFVNLSNQSNGSIADGQGLGTITNDDQATLSVSSVSNPEGDMGTQTYTFTVTLDKEVDVPFMVDINANDGTATQPSDYLPNSATLNFAGTAGETETFDVTVNDDMIVEPNETFVVGLHSLTVTGRNIVLGPAGTGTITNDDAATITIDDVTMMEGDAGTVNFVFSVTLSKVVSTAVSVDFIATGVTAASGVDFNPNSGTVIFPANGAGQTQTITVQVIGDVMGEANETFTVDLSNIVGSPSVTFADAQGLGTILDDDLAFSINDVTLSEGNAGTTNFTFTVTRTSTATAESIQYATADNTATTGDNDYVSTNGTLNFAIGDDSETISVTINGDLKVEPNETFFVNLSNASMGAIADGQGVGTINNDDAAVVHLTLLDATKNEGTGGTTDFTFKATLDNPVQDGFDLAFTVTDGTATDADDYDVITTSPLSFTGTANEMQIITVRVNADAKVEADETFDVTIEDSGFSNTALAASLSTASTVTATIQNDDAATIFISDVTKLEGISGPTLYTFGVVLSADVQGGVMVDFMTADNTATAPSDYSSFMGTLSFDGTLWEIKTLTHIVNGDCIEEADETFFMNLSNIVAAVEPGAITFLNNDNQGIGTIQNDDATYVGGIIYVDENAAGLNNGADWTNAFNDFQDALRVACTCGVGQIWVADGTYYP